MQTQASDPNCCRDQHLPNIPTKLGGLPRASQLDQNTIKR